jgi:hypothetical protein
MLEAFKNEVAAFVATIRACEDSRFARDPFDGSDDLDGIERVNEDLADFRRHQGEPTHTWTHEGCTVYAWLSRRNAKRSIELRIAEFGDHLIVHQAKA